MNKNIIYVLLAGLGKIFGELIYRMDNDIKNHPFIIGIASAFGMCFSFIPLIYFKTKSEKPNKRILLSYILSRFIFWNIIIKFKELWKNLKEFTIIKSTKNAKNIY